MCKKTKFCSSIEWSLYTSFTVNTSCWNSADSPCLLLLLPVLLHETNLFARLYTVHIHPPEQRLVGIFPTVNLFVCSPGMVSALDEAVKNITDSLKQNGLWENTLLVFSTGESSEVVN